MRHRISFLGALELDYLLSDFVSQYPKDAAQRKSPIRSFFRGAMSIKCTYLGANVTTKTL